MRRTQLLVPLLLLSGCLVDEDNPCSPGEEQNAEDYCVCQPNHVPVSRNLIIGGSDDRLRDGCEPCGDNEVAEGSQCVCADGFVQGPDGCITSNLGSACSSDAECATGDQTFCAEGAYCSSAGCAGDDDCVTAAGYICVDDGGSSFCRRPPTGEGAACAFNPANPIAGCGDQGFEAQVCFPLGANGPECVSICDPAADLCSAGRECCPIDDGSGNVTPLCLEGCP